MPTLNTSTLATPAQQLAPAALTPAAFAAFGTVLQAPPGPGHLINAGTSERFDLVDMGLRSVDLFFDGLRAR